MSDPFVKLYATLLESSLWWGEDATTRLVWITLLVAADHEGIYQGTLPGLAGKARVSLDEARHAVWRLQQPDEESRTKDYDGRRIEVVAGVGYRLLNYQKYRDKRSPKQVADAVYKARQRERQKSPDGSDMSTGSGEVSLISTLSSGISDLGSDPDPEIAPPVPVAKASAVTDGGCTPEVTVVRRKSNVAPDDFEPNDAHRVRCQELRLDIGELVRAFKLQEFNRDYSDWPKRFSKWIETDRLTREKESFKASQRGGVRPRSDVFDYALKRIAEEQAKEGK